MRISVAVLLCITAPACEQTPTGPADGAPPDEAAPPVDLAFLDAAVPGDATRPDFALPADRAAIPDETALPDATELPDSVELPDLSVVGAPLGAICAVDGDCQSQLCKAVVIDSNPVCVAPCAQLADCTPQGSGYFCDPITAGSAQGYCVPHSPAHCLSCTTDADCGSLSELCFQAPGDIALACHVDCTLSGAGACPPDYACVSLQVQGVTRQLCRPKIVPTCLDAIGGYCDRLTIPQPCTRQNAAGTCIGQRACMPASKRFDKCDAMAPQCKPDCTVQDPAGCMEVYCPGVPAC